MIPIPAGEQIVGLVPFWTDPATSRVYATLPDRLELLLTSHLMTGMGSSGITFDRGMQGRTQQVVFERRGSVMTLVQLNKKWVAHGEPAEVEVGAASFVRSVIWSAPIEQTLDGTSTVDITTLVLRDHLGIADDLAPSTDSKVKLDASGEGKLTLDPTRSFVDPSTSSNHPTHTELSAWITFAVDNPGPRVRELATDPHSLTFGIRLSLVAMPVGFSPRSFDPASGGFGKGVTNLAAHPTEGTETLLQPRFRTDGNHTIVFNVDPGIPEPYLSAAVEGGNWWAEAFAAAGLPSKYRVQVLPEGIDPFAAGTNMVWWVHRTGRGWSRAAASIDIRTGEIIHANVRLGSQRIHQLTSLFEALLSPYGRPDEAERNALIESTIVTPIKHLAAHEIGHALGFVHNYASTNHRVPSVMDYPHPRLDVTDEGTISLANAYTPALGEWDYELVRRAYAPAHLAGPASDPLPFVSDLDGHGPDAAAADGVPWTFGADPEESLAVVLRARSIALGEFGEGTVKPGRQLGEIEGRFYLVYLLHRHQAHAVARQIGGVHYNYGLVGGARAGTRVVPPAQQREALATVVALLSPEVLDVSPAVLSTVTPPSLRSARSADAATPLAGPLFDSTRAAEIAAGVVLEHCFAPGRLNRLWDQRVAGLDVPSVSEIVEVTFAAALALQASGTAAAAAGAAWAFGRWLVWSASAERLHPWVRAEMLETVRALCLAAEQTDSKPLVAPVMAALLRFVDTGQAGALGTVATAPLGIPL